LENRNLLLGTEEALKQAERDFNYVLEVAPRHFFAYFSLAEIKKKGMMLIKEGSICRKLKIYWKLINHLLGLFIFLSLE